MATKVVMKKQETGQIKDGFTGFSWTYFFFGFFVPLFRGDQTQAIVMHLLLSVVGWFTLNIPQLVMAFLYNKQYTVRLITDGFRFADADVVNEKAARELDVELSKVVFVKEA